MLSNQYNPFDYTQSKDITSQRDVQSRLTSQIRIPPDFSGGPNIIIDKFVDSAGHQCFTETIKTLEIFPGTFFSDQIFFDRLIADTALDFTHLTVVNLLGMCWHLFSPSF